MGDLSQKYGMLPSCGTEGECLTVTDPDEAWIFHVYSTGFGWLHDSGKPGSVWAAQRVPDDEVVIVPNIGRIRQIDPKDTKNFMVSDSYMQHAIDTGLYDPKSGDPSTSGRCTLQQGMTTGPSAPCGSAAASIPFIGPRPEPRGNPMPPRIPALLHQTEKKISVQDVMALIREYNKGSVFGMSEHPAWLIAGKERQNGEKPPDDPFPTKRQAKLLKIPYSRTISVYNCAYG
ncbi:hypothetical protein MASR2M17_09090 [Aminivibrio sp.]